MQKNATIDFRLGSKYGSLQFCQKVFILKTFPNFLCLYSCHAYFILSLKSEKCVTERNKRLNLWSLYLVTKETSSCFRLIGSWKILVLDLMPVVLEFLSNEEGLNCFLWHVLSKLSKITDMSKVSKKDWTGSILTCPKLAK